MSNCNIESIDKVKLLNEKIFEFLDYLNDIISINEMNIDGKNINKLKNQIKLGLMYDNFLVMDLFENHILKYKDYIINRNEFIINEIQNKILDNKIKLYSMWKNINNENKDVIWKYLNVFLLLVE